MLLVSVAKAFQYYHVYKNILQLIEKLNNYDM